MKRALVSLFLVLSLTPAAALAADPAPDVDCEHVVFSDGDSYGCSVIAATHFRGITSYTRAKTYLERLAKGKKAAKVFESFNKALEAHARRVYGPAFSHYEGFTKDTTAAELRGLLLTEGTRLDIAHAHYVARMARGTAATAKRTADAAAARPIPAPCPPPANKPAAPAPQKVD